MWPLKYLCVCFFSTLVFQIIKLNLIKDNLIENKMQIVDGDLSRENKLNKLTRSIVKNKFSLC